VQRVLDEERLEFTTNFQISVIRSKPDNLFLPIENPATVDLKRPVRPDLRVGPKNLDLRIGWRLAICFIRGKSDDGLDRIFPMLGGDGGSRLGRPQIRETPGKTFKIVTGLLATMLPKDIGDRV
jgi:hypothetical protein